MAFTVSFDQSWIIRNVKVGGDFAAPQSEPTPALKVKVYPQWFKQTSIDWTFPPEWGNCTFHVYYSPGPDEQFERLTSQPLTEPRLTSTLSRETSKFRHEYYTVEAILPGGTRFRSFPTPAGTVTRNHINLRSSEIQRREYMLLTKFVGVRTFHFKRRFYGERCPRCWNPAQEKVVDDHCPVCFGTSFKGGYYNPIPIFVQYEPTPNERMLSYLGNLEPNQIGAWTISMPEISSGDILIRSGDWNLYTVIRTAATELQTNAVRQLMTLTQLAHRDVENELMNRHVTDDTGRYLEALGGDFSKTRFPRNQIDGSPDNDYNWSKDNSEQLLPVKYRV